MDKIKILLANCKCGVHIQVNAHRDYYETAKQHLENAEMGEEGSLNIPPDVRKIMEATNTVVSVVFYPDTPIGSYRIYHHDLPTAIDLALSCLPLCKRCGGTGREYISGTAAASGREYVCSVCKGTGRVPSSPPNASDQRAAASVAPLHQLVGCEPSTGETK